MAMVSISLHNIPEGIAVYLTCLKARTLPEASSEAVDRNR